MNSVVIIGGGLVGAATALALHKAGIKSAMYDQVNPMEVVMRGDALEFGESGGAVMIQAGGLRVLRTLGLLDECLANGLSSPYVTWAKIDGSSEIIGDMRIWNKKAGETDTRLLTPLHILRSKILIQACHRVGIKTHVGKKLVGVTQDENSVTATFADGTTATSDLLIGADGIHSATRRNVFGENLTAKFTGETGYIGVVNIKEHNITIKETDDVAFYIDRDHKYFVAVFKVSPEIAAVRVSTFEDPEEEDQSYRPFNDLPKHAGRLADLMQSWGVAPNVVKMMRCAFRISAASIYDLPDLESYNKDRVILIGDAAHGMVPNAGIGLLTGLEDVGTLLPILRHYPDGNDWKKALAMYSKVRVARGTAAANQARNMRAKGMAASVFGGGLNHFVFRLVVAGGNNGLFTLYTLFDCEEEVSKLIEEESK
ncbi:FAD/NAD(P)-binding domain-containing protein [Rhizoclosmatium globosum]|uniref:FAD/NAD(P)-binding domain-containing protein n=1 Tax=Rhizoclosmatium globosum TaxID=329046 RepID=A0A1Y2BTY8_9FUNG|nr:FAD/NAD(P)-binding domain-containing protein [Rhizoclosmatium globosum]|eukprot:ORY38222.1 FAD/NAD(P)-binding domain-containing protein [Rhizoclosmatium globosum]